MNWQQILKAPIWNMPAVSKDTRVMASKLKWSMEKNYTFSQNNEDFKPKGIYYGFGDSWISWIRTDMPEWSDRYKYVYEVKVSGNILKLNTEEEHKEFSRKYSNTEDKRIIQLREAIEEMKNEDLPQQVKDKNIKMLEAKISMWKYELGRINWSKVAQDYDGIEVKGGELHGKSLRDKELDWLFPWDVDSGCVWNTNAIKIVKTLFSKDDPEWIDDPPLEDWRGF